MEVTNMFLLLTAGLSWTVVTAQCPPTTVVSNLNLKKFMGHWYEHASVGTLFLNGLDRCKESNFTLGEDGQTITMDNYHIAFPFYSSKSVRTVRMAKANGTDGRLTVNIKIPVVGNIKIPFMVIDTDYDNYAVINVCQNIFFFKLDAGFILTRQRSYTTEDLNKIYTNIDKALANNRLQRRNFVLSNNKNCISDNAAIVTVDTSSTTTAAAAEPVVQSQVQHEATADNVHTNDALVEEHLESLATALGESESPSKVETKVESEVVDKTPIVSSDLLANSEAVNPSVGVEGSFSVSSGDSHSGNTATTA